MNIFVLHESPVQAAQMHCDKHVVKMLLESAQLLCSAYYYTGQDELTPYKLAHKNHPCSVWVRESLDNWLWLYQLGLALYDEYQHRYNGKVHKSGEVIKGLQIPALPFKGLTPFAQAMPDKYKNEDAVVAYRAYYHLKQQEIQFKYTNRQQPSWL